MPWEQYQDRNHSGQAATPVKCEVVKVLQERSWKQGKQGYEIRLVRWNDGKPMLEKREWFIAENGERRTGKAKGFTKEDFATVLALQDQIIGLMDGQSAPPTQAKLPLEEEEDSIPF